MKKQAVTYYHDFMRGGYSNITLHESGAEATEFFKANAGQYFQTPILWKNKNLKLTGKNRLSASIGFRGFYARFLTEEESDVVKEFGNKTMINNETGELCAPDSILEEVTK